MSLVIAGTICFDTIETPAGRVDRVLGGSGVFAAVAAALVVRPCLVGAVGRDFEPAREMLTSRGIDLRGVETVAEARTQFWHGRYHAGLHSREHIDVDLDILGRMNPMVPSDLRDSPHLFLAHMPPDLQHRVLDQAASPRLAFADTIDYWITTRRPEVVGLCNRVSGVVVNDGEAELLTGECDLLRAARAIQRMGPRCVIIKKGEHGILIRADEEFIALPAYPTEEAIDSTGAGDAFAGTMMAALAVGLPIKQAAAMGVVAASFTVESFGMTRLLALTRAELDERLARYKEMLRV